MSKTAPTRTPAPSAGQPLIDRRRAMLRLGIFAAAAAATHAGPAAGDAAAAQSMGSGAESCSGAGTVWWSELVCPDPDQSRDFYTAVIGWQHNTVALSDPSRPPYIGEPDYTVFTTGGRESAGLVRTDTAEPSQSRPGWLTYIQVADVDASVRIAADKGGKIVKHPFDMSGVGRIALIEDPSGMMVGLVTPAQNGSC
jgi:predicted enzyme related to lactoylglutathione lyase